MLTFKDLPGASVVETVVDATAKRIVTSRSVMSRKDEVYAIDAEGAMVETANGNPQACRVHFAVDLSECSDAQVLRLAADGLFLAKLRERAVNEYVAHPEKRANAALHLELAYCDADFVTQRAAGARNPERTVLANAKKMLAGGMSKADILALLEGAL